jgi:hypothetical protein
MLIDCFSVLACASMMWSERVPKLAPVMTAISAPSGLNMRDDGFVRCEPWVLLCRCSTTIAAVKSPSSSTTSHSTQAIQLFDLDVVKEAQRPRDIRDC